MLWYKSWLETRARFLVSLGCMVVLTSYIVYQENQGAEGLSLNWYYHTLHFVHALFAVMWVAAITLLMMGGLLREKSAGTSSFTLALPASRTRLMCVRILFGLLQSIALVVITWTVVFTVAATTGKANSVPQAIYHVLLLALGGLPFWGLALLVSSLVEGEYTAPTITFGIVFVDAIVAASGHSVEQYSTLNLMLGVDHFDRKTELLVGPIPWPHLMINVVIAMLLAIVAVRVIQRREF